MDCNNNYLGIEAHLRAMARVSTAGLIGLPIVAVTGHNDTGTNCENTYLDFWQFLAASIGVDSCGKPAIRVKFIDSCETQLNCNNSADANIYRQFFAYDATTKTYALVLNQST